MHPFNVLIYYFVCFIEVSLGTQDQMNSNSNYLKETLVNKSMLSKSFENQATKELTDASHSKVKLKKRSLFTSDETFIDWAEDIFLVRPIDETPNRPLEGDNNVPFTANSNALNEIEPIKEEAVKLLETKPLFVLKKKGLAKKGVINKSGYNNNIKSKILKSQPHQQFTKHDVNERPQQDMVVSNTNKSVDVVTEISMQPYVPSTDKYDELKSSVDSTTISQSYIQTDSPKTSKTEISKQPYAPSTDKYDELKASVDSTTTPQLYVQTDSSKTSKTDISKPLYELSTDKCDELISPIDSTTTLQPYQTELPKKANNTNKYHEITSSVDPITTSPSYQTDSPKKLDDTIIDKPVDKKPEHRALEDLVELYYKLAYTKRWNDVKELYKYLQKRLKVISEEDNNYFLDNRKRFHELIEHTKKHFKPAQKHVSKLRNLFVIYADEPVVATEVSDESNIIDEDFEKRLSLNVSKPTTWGNKSTNNTDFSTLSYLFNNTQTTPDYSTNKVSSNMGNVKTNFNQSKVEEYFSTLTANNSSQSIKIESEFEKPKVSTQSNTESEEMVENTENIISNGFIQAVTNTFKHVTIDSDSQATEIDTKPDKIIKSISVLTADNEMEPESLTGELQLKESQKVQPVSLIDSEVKTPVSELNKTESNEAIDTTVSQLITVTSTNSSNENEIIKSHPTSFTPANTQTEFTNKENIHSNIYQEDKEMNNNKVLDTNSGTTHADDNNNIPSRPINEKGRRSLTTNSDIQLYAGGKMYILKPEQPYTDLTGIEYVDITHTNNHEDINQYVTLSADVNTDTDNDLYFESSATLTETSTNVYNTFVMTDIGHDMPARYPNIYEKEPYPVSAFGETRTKVAGTKIKDDNFNPHLQTNAENIIISSTNYQAMGYLTKDSNNTQIVTSITSAENIEPKDLDMKTTVDYSTSDKKHVENKTDPRTDKMNLQSEMTSKPNKINANFNQSYIKTSYLDFYKNIFGPLSDIGAETFNNESPPVFNASNVNKDNYLNKQTTIKDIYIKDTLSLKNNITLAQLYKNLAQTSYQFRDNTTPMAQTEQDCPEETTRKSVNTVEAIIEKTANNSQIENYNVLPKYSNQITTEKIIVKKELNAPNHKSKKLSEESEKMYRKFMNEFKSVDRSIKPVNVSETTTERFLSGVDDENLAIGDHSQRVPLTLNNYIKTKNILQETLNTTKKIYNWFSHTIHTKRQKYIKEIKDVVNKYKELIKFQINPELDIDYQEVDKSRNKSNLRRLISTNESTLTTLNISKSNTTSTTAATSVNTVTDKTDSYDSYDLEDMYNKRLKNVNIQKYKRLSKNRFESSGFNTDNAVSNDKTMYDKNLVLKSADKSLSSNMRSSSDVFNSLISSLASRFVPEPWDDYKLRKTVLNTQQFGETYATIDDAPDLTTEAVTEQEDIAAYTNTFALNTYTKQRINNNNHSIRRSCGIDKTLNADIVEGTVRRDLYPWLGVLYYPRYDEPLLSNVALVKSEIAVSLMLDVLRYPKDDLISLAVICFGQSCPETGVGLRNYSVRAEYRAEGFATTLVLLHLDLEKMEQKTVLIPICMPPHTVVTSKLYAIVPNEVYSSSTVKVYEMSYVTKSKCRAYYNKTELNVASIWPRHWVCARTRAYTHECVWPNGVLLAVRQKDRWHLLGFSVTGPGCAAPARFVDYGQYYQWVAYNLIEDLPLYKMDHPLDKVDHAHDVVTALDKVGHAKVKTATKVVTKPVRVDRNFVKGDYSFARAYRETNNSANGTNSEEIITIL